MSSIYLVLEHPEWLEYNTTATGTPVITYTFSTDLEATIPTALALLTESQLLMNEMILSGVIGKEQAE